MTTTTPNVKIAIDAILAALGDPQGDWQWQVYKEFREGDADSARKTAASNLGDNFCKSLGFLVSAKIPTPNLPNILSAAAIAAADHVEQRTLVKLGDNFADDFNSENPDSEGIKSVLKFLSPASDLHKMALELFQASDYDGVKKLAASNLDDNLFKALSYLSSATKPSPALPTILAEAAREAAKHVRAQIVRSLSTSISAALN
ncbi:MAG: hypothetical protein RM347_033965 [Nostoc sp. ChiQUE02]|uniref:hypothetical protein n=1 Tax=Nostoc sp. ChiQUE02 TaxID=3075377 RepID=UPI002AD28E25|nr:hypothetical protein [Nostoc sp. ChiQUE02]MDZ8229634.1 hypothetical protein [Nostoc sp. ChiQUE02]